MGHCGHKSQDADALLAAFVHERQDSSGWEALRGWTIDSDPCAANAWTGVSCTNERVTSAIIQDYPNLQFELFGQALGQLNQLVTFAVSNTAVYGTIPTEIGNLTQLQELHLYSNPTRAVCVCTSTI